MGTGRLEDVFKTSFLTLTFRARWGWLNFRKKSLCNFHQKSCKMSIVRVICFSDIKCLFETMLRYFGQLKFFVIKKNLQNFKFGFFSVIYYRPLRIFTKDLKKSLILHMIHFLYKRQNKLVIRNHFILSIWVFWPSFIEICYGLLFWNIGICYSKPKYCKT